MPASSLQTLRSSNDRFTTGLSTYIVGLGAGDNVDVEGLAGGEEHEVAIGAGGRPGNVVTRFPLWRIAHQHVFHQAAVCVQDLLGKTSKVRRRQTKLRF